ncbi:Ferrochelatase, protoheme ferro-lyase [Methylophaga frappieri]|uniref:Ferrochelatase n=1 Tax=Methylophaga frappieri (strain ATCC BAA-2434 / DSM 25690 / JAM7) TaxID=754477 RepID=I1YI57_METFJ|nr:ferrochelatase [Methylophaga frappieri]AFJ02600.1 Ferrochelatase, protoheme ferro-lyase [Methylophaga frappieri]
MSERAILLANLGSPDAPDTPAVRRYLNQFLMDPYVIQLPWILRRLIVSLLVLPTRPKSSAAAYQSIWWPAGSPLIVLSEQLRDAVQAEVAMPVHLAMRYGNPAIESTLLEIATNPAIKEVVYLPLYPHYADSTIATSIDEAERVIEEHDLDLKLIIPAPFYQEPDYIDALYQQSLPYLSQPYDHLIFSYHGLPESHITGSDPSGAHCLQRQDCCQQPHPAHATCYRHQVMATTQAFAKKAGLAQTDYTVAFQSRLGRQVWLGPNTEDILTQLAKEGARNVMVMCPAFVTDCLETLEEIAIRGKEVFVEAGGESLTLIPCLNVHPAWVSTLAKWLRQA